MPNPLDPEEENADNVFDELLDWINQIESLTHTIQRRIDRATEKSNV